MIGKGITVYIEDARKAADGIVRFSEGLTSEGYAANEILRPAIEREFTIIGEAVATIRKHAPDIAARINHAGRIVAFRNILIHNYASIDNELVWGVIEGDLPALIRQLDQLLKSCTTD